MTAHGPRTGLRVLHVLAIYDPREAQGRCMHTIASHAAGEHFLVCSRSSGECQSVFTGIVETGAPLCGFGWLDRRRILDAVQSIRPDVIHFHGGPLGATTMASGWTSGVPAVASIYGWPTVSRRSWGGGVGIGHLRRTPVLVT